MAAEQPALSRMSLAQPELKNVTVSCRQLGRGLSKDGVRRVVLGRQERRRQSSSKSEEQRPKVSPKAAIGHVYTLLARLNPAKRRCVLQRCLTEEQRRLLESWILAGSTATHRQSPGGMRSDSSRLTQVGRVSQRQGLKARRPDRGIITERRKSKASGCIYKMSYSSNACIGDLQITSRCRSSRVEAAADHAVLDSVRRKVAAATACGQNFEDAARSTFSSVLTGRPRRPRAGSMAEDIDNPFFRFHVGLQLAGRFDTTVRSPAIYSLEAALEARARMRSALHVEPKDITTLSHKELLGLMLRLRQVHAALHAEAAASSASSAGCVDAAVAAALTRFDMVERRVQEFCEKRTLASLSKFLGHEAMARLDTGVSTLPELAKDLTSDKVRAEVYMGTTALAPQLAAVKRPVCTEAVQPASKCSR